MDNKVTSKKYKYTISFPHIGNYYIPIYNWLSSIIDKDTTKIMVPKKMSKHTIEIGAKYSPDFNLKDISFKTIGRECRGCANNCEIIDIYKDENIIDSMGKRCEKGSRV